MLYWLTNTAGSAARSFVETPGHRPGHLGGVGAQAARRCPRRVSVFPKDILRPIRRFGRTGQQRVSWCRARARRHLSPRSSSRTSTSADVRAFFTSLA
ncbi:hypothetical protein [Nonomuraea dietziae]|uniref:hypothetical protein n=1 Tax=Nonomuraea dietziae TaxID=65515 RepID=UPI0031DB91B9